MGDMNDCTDSREGMSYDDYPSLSTIVPCQIAADSVSVFLCVTIILAITLPILNKDERKKMQSYNLYLVYMAIPDMVYSCANIYVFANIEEAIAPCNPFMHQNASPKTHLPFVYSRVRYATTRFSVPSNLWINAVILYELLELLRNSKHRRRTKPPSLLRASLQAFAIYAFFSVWAFIYSFDFVFDALSSKRWVLLLLLSLGTTSRCIPLVYITWGSFRIHREQLLSYNAEAERSLKILVNYFGRIVSLNVCSALLSVLSLGTIISSWASFFYLYNMLYAIQIWLGFGLILTKPDVKSSICRIWTCGNCSLMRTFTPPPKTETHDTQEEDEGKNYANDESEIEAC